MVNQLTDCVRAMFKWGVAEELLPETVYMTLMSVDGLRKGKVQAREHIDVKPVPIEIVNKTLPHLSIHVREMVRLQMLTGARSGEVCDLRREQLEQIDPVWVWRPFKHKTQHHGKERVIAVGPQAQAILKPLLDGLRDDEVVFSPKRAREERYRLLRAARKSKVQPSQESRKKKQPRKQPREEYTAESFAQSIADACERRGLPHWHPHQLRHTHATEVRRKFGLEGAQIALGHAHADVTQIYAERNMELAAKIAQAMG